MSGLTVSTEAMTLDDFAAMNDDDEATYVTLLVESSAKMLKAKGQPDLADKAIALFNDTSNNGGVHQFADNLKTMHGLNIRNGMNPNNRAPIYQVEDAMSRTLKDAGITVTTKDLLNFGKDFSPEGPKRSYKVAPSL